MAASAATAIAGSAFHQAGAIAAPRKHLLLPLHPTRKAAAAPGLIGAREKGGMRTKCGPSLGDFIGGDLVKLDIGQWLSDVEEHKALAIYSPHEGGYEGRYLIRLAHQGYHFLDLSARGLGDPETTLTKFHPVCPVRILLNLPKI